MRSKYCEVVSSTRLNHRAQIRPPRTSSSSFYVVFMCLNYRGMAGENSHALHCGAHWRKRLPVFTMPMRVPTDPLILRASPIAANPDRHFDAICLTRCEKTIYSYADSECRGQLLFRFKPWQATYVRPAFYRYRRVQPEDAAPPIAGGVHAAIRWDPRRHMLATVETGGFRQRFCFGLHGPRSNGTAARQRW